MKPTRVALNFCACKMENLEHTVGDGGFPGWYSQTALYVHLKGAINSVRINRVSVLSGLNLEEM